MIALLGFDGRLPKTVPDLLHLGPGFVERRLYVVAKVAVINAILLGAFIVGTLMHRTINRMLDSAIGARENALDMLTTRNRELLELSSAIAHELKNPLASIQGLVQLLARGGANSQERIAVLEREVARMRDTLDELLNFSRPLGDLSKKPVPLSPLIEELTRIHEGLTHAKGITVVLPAKNPGTIVADPRKLGQALVNLFQNAIEAVATGGRIQWIAVERSGWLELGVEDDGPGIDPALKHRIGRQSGDTTKPAGSGIGLAVARAIAEQHGGTLSIEDREGGGVVALLRIPTGRAAEAA
jgi:signal transduction histidine kinase